MIGEVLSLIVAVARSWFVPRSRLQAEIMILRHQLNMLRRSANRRPHLTAGDRLLFVWLYRRRPGALRSLAILRPETVVRWHRAGFRVYWRWKSQGRAGRPAIGNDVRDLIREVSRTNPLWRELAR